MSLSKWKKFAEFFFKFIKKRKIFSILFSTRFYNIICKAITNGTRSANKYVDSTTIRSSRVNNLGQRVSIFTSRACCIKRCCLMLRMCTDRLKFLIPAAATASSPTATAAAVTAATVSTTTLLLNDLNANKMKVNAF